MEKKLMKICDYCKREFEKPVNCSIKEWNKYPRKFCSRKCQHLAEKGRKRPPRSEKYRKKQSLVHTGIKRPYLSGEKHFNWKGGISKINDVIRHSIEGNLWRNSVFARDGYTCQKTGIKGRKLVAHHILNFSKYPELRFAIDNGITLSEKAHREFHKKYGIKNNTEEQLSEFLAS